MAVIRVVLGMLIAVAVVVAAIPAVVLVDLVSGGTGLGLCEEGLGRCTTSGFALAELAIVLGVVAVVIGGGIAACVRLLRRADAPTTRPGSG
jgi:hypothetical protein